MARVRLPSMWRSCALASLVLLTSSPALSQGGVAGISPSAFPQQRTVAQLPTASSASHGQRIVTDGASSTDCTVGGGSTTLICLDTGSAWTAVGSGGGGGSGDITAVGSCTTGACFQSETARHALLAPVLGGIATFRAITEADISDLGTYATTTHATTHSDGGTDEITAENLATSCTDGQILEASSGGWVCAADDTGGSVPGSDTQVIFNDSGAFGADADLTFDGLDLDLGGDLEMGTQAFVFDASTAGTNAITISKSSKGIKMSGNSNYFTVTSNVAAFPASVWVMETASLTNPFITWDYSFRASGLGGSGHVGALISNSVAVLEWENDGTDTKVTMTDVYRSEPRATAPASCTLGDFYVDSSGALCGCNTSNAWEISDDLSDGGSPNCT